MYNNYEGMNANLHGWTGPRYPCVGPTGSHRLPPRLPAGARHYQALRGSAQTCMPGQMIKMREDQVQNSTGGYVFPVNDENRIRRFLILGTSGGTYYSSEKELTLDNVKALEEIILKGGASLILKEIREISLAGRSPKQDTTMLALALCARFRVHDMDKKASEATQHYSAYLKKMHKDAFDLVNEVCRIPTHLFAFVKYCEMVSQRGFDGKDKSTGWGRLMRAVIAKWYTSRTPEQLAMHMTKYVQRDGWSHRDLLRLSHPKLKQPNLEMEQLFHFAVKGTLNPRKRRLPEDSEEAMAAKAKYTEDQLALEDNSKALDIVETFLQLKASKDEKEALEGIQGLGLVREHLPTELLNSTSIWKALLENMPMTAMIRNLGRMQSMDILNGDYEQKVIQNLTDQEKLKSARIHPINILLAKAIYDQGCGDKGSLKWTPKAEISKALEDGFYKAFVNVNPTGKRFCLAFDVSSSMCAPISGTCLSAREASAAIGLFTLKKEPHVECMAFCHTFQTLPYNKNWTLKKVLKDMERRSFGSTDCSLPMIWAKQEKKQFDVFMVFTDCETYFGLVHPFEALRAYRESSGIDARLVVLGMTATNFTIADPSDAGMLDVVGFDSAVPELVSRFVLGEI